MAGNPFALNGKIALVTGAGSGIGQETARQLLELGAQVIATDLDGAAAAATAGTAMEAHAHDVRKPDDWARVYAAIAAAHGHLDILVNNAGIMLSQPIDSADIDYLHRQQAINVDGMYLGIRGALPLMRAAIAQNGGTTSIINISSVYGMVAGARFAAYSATKGAVRGLTRATAFELAAEGIRVNAVLPGPCATNLGASWEPPTDANGKPLSPEEAYAYWVSLIPMGRIGEPRDIAPVVAFLASDAARWVTGADFVADGGYTAC